MHVNQVVLQLNLQEHPITSDAIVKVQACAILELALIPCVNQPVVEWLTLLKDATVKLEQIVCQLIVHQEILVSQDAMQLNQQDLLMPLDAIVSRPPTVHHQLANKIFVNQHVEVRPI